MLGPSATQKVTKALCQQSRDGGRRGGSHSCGCWGHFPARSFAELTSTGNTPVCTTQQALNPVTVPRAHCPVPVARPAPVPGIHTRSPPSGRSPGCPTTRHRTRHITRQRHCPGAALLGPHCVRLRDIRHYKTQAPGGKPATRYTRPHGAARPHSPPVFSARVEAQVKILRTPSPCDPEISSQGRAGAHPCSHPERGPSKGC